MKKEYRKLLRDLFSKRRTALLPEFGQVSKESGFYICAAWWQMAPDYWSFVAVRAHPSWESFGFDIGWNSSRAIPFPDAQNEQYWDYYGDAMKLDANTVALQLIADGEESLWELFSLEETVADVMLLIEPLPTKAALDRIEPLFEDAATLLSNKGVPYLKRVAKGKGFL